MADLSAAPCPDAPNAMPHSGACIATLFNDASSGVESCPLLLSLWCSLDLKDGNRAEEKGWRRRGGLWHVMGRINPFLRCCASNFTSTLLRLLLVSLVVLFVEQTTGLWGFFMDRHWCHGARGHRDHDTRAEGQTTSHFTILISIGALLWQPLNEENYNESIVQWFSNCGS